MTTKLTQLLADACRMEDRAEQERQAAVAAGCEVARAAVMAAFDGLWEEVAPYADAGDFWPTNDHAGVATWWTVISLPGVAPFSACWWHDYGGGCFLVAAERPKSGWGRTPFKELPEFLLRQKRIWEEQEKKRLAEAIKAEYQKLDGYFCQIVHTAEEADAALARLSSLDLAHADEWVSARRRWQDGHDARKRERLEAEAEETHQVALAAQYEAAFAAYWRAYNLTREINQSRLDAFQAELDRPIQVWKLTYGIVAQDEDGGEPWLDTKEVYVLSDRPDPDGYYVVAGRRTPLRRMRYAHVVSVEGPVETRPTENEVCVSVRFDAPGRWDWFSLRFDPALDREEIAAAAAGLLEPWPERPAVPDGLSERNLAAVRRRVIGEDGGQEDL